MRASRLIPLGVLALMAAMPEIVGSYQLSFLVQLLMMVALAQSWNMISGMTGYVSFGHAAFFGVGAYTGTLLLLAGFDWWLAVFLAAAMATAIACLRWPRRKRAAVGPETSIWTLSVSRRRTSTSAMAMRSSARCMISPRGTPAFS